MAEEIERKFLLEERPLWLERCESVEIAQGYLALDGAAEVRVRRTADGAALTVKLGAGGAREEVEVALAAEQAKSLWPACKGRRLRKRRYVVPLEEGLHAEVDEYAGSLEGLRVVEVEFLTEHQAQAFSPPEWFGVEVSGDPRYANRALAVDGPPRPHPSGHGRAYRLHGDEEPAAGLRRIAAGRAGKALDRLRGTNPAEDGFAAAVHGARKDMKKLRALLRLARGTLGGGVYREENRRFRDAARRLSASRDAQVKLETLAALAERHPDLPGDAVNLWRGELERERGASEAGEEALAEAIAAIEAGAARIEEWPLEGRGWELVDEGLLRAYSRGREAMRRARGDGGAESFHEWRKRAKDLWYQHEILRDSWPEVLGGAAEEAHRLSEALGDHHDLALLDEDLGRRTVEPAREESLRAAIASSQAELTASAFALGERLYAEKPKAYRRRLRGYWRAWR